MRFTKPLSLLLVLCMILSLVPISAFAQEGDVIADAPAHEHSCTATVTEPTCTGEGFTVYTCGECGDSYTADYTDPLGHDWQEASRIEASTESEGEIVYTCSRCDAVKTESIDRLEAEPGQPEQIEPTEQPDQVGQIESTEQPDQVGQTESAEQIEQATAMDAAVPAAEQEAQTLLAAGNNETVSVYLTRDEYGSVKVVMEGSAYVDSSNSGDYRLVNVNASEFVNYDMNSCYIADYESGIDLSVDVTLSFDTETRQLRIAETALNKGNGVDVGLRVDTTTCIQYYAVTCTSSEGGAVKADVPYALPDDEVFFTVTPGDHYMLKSLIVRENTGDLEVMEEESGRYCFRMPASDVKVSAVFEVAEAYLDLDGETKTANCVPVSGSDLEWADGWYVVSENVTLEYRITTAAGSDVNLVLTDKATLNAAHGIDVLANSSLTIWCQSEKSGALTVPARDEALPGIWGTSITINGGNITTSGGTRGGIECDSVTINGGNVTATGNPGIGVEDGTVSLRWTDSDDSIQADSYAGTVTLEKPFVDENGVVYRAGTLSDSSVLNDKMLKPAPHEDRDFTVTFDPDNGSNPTEQTVSEGSVAEEPEEPVKDGYVFLGWYQVTDGTVSEKKFDFSTAIDGDIALKALWMEEYYYVLVGGVQVKSSNMKDILGDGNVSYEFISKDEGGILTFTGSPESWPGTKYDALVLSYAYPLKVVTPQEGLTMYSETAENGIQVDGTGLSLTVDGDVNITVSGSALQANGGSVTVNGNVTAHGGTPYSLIYATTGIDITGDVIGDNVNGGGLFTDTGTVSVGGDIRLDVNGRYLAYGLEGVTVKGSVTGSNKNGAGLYVLDRAKYSDGNGTVSVGGDISLTTTNVMVYARYGATVGGSVTGSVTGTASDTHGVFAPDGGISIGKDVSLTVAHGHLLYSTNPDGTIFVGGDVTGTAAAGSGIYSASGTIEVGSITDLKVNGDYMVYAPNGITVHGDVTGENSSEATNGGGLVVGSDNLIIEGSVELEVAGGSLLETSGIDMRIEVDGGVTGTAGNGSGLNAPSGTVKVGGDVDLTVTGPYLIFGGDGITVEGTLTGVNNEQSGEGLWATGGVITIGEDANVTINSGWALFGGNGIEAKGNLTATTAARFAILANQPDAVVTVKGDVTVTAGSNTAIQVPNGTVEVQSGTWHVTSNDGSPAIQAKNGFTIPATHSITLPAGGTAGPHNFGTEEKQDIQYTILTSDGETVASEVVIEPQEVFTVTFNPDGGTEVEAQSVISGEKAIRPEVPTKDGCTFKGWYQVTATDQETLAEEAFDFENTAITGDITLKAVWEEAKKPEFKSKSLVLSGQIGVNFFMNLPAIEGMDYSDSYMTFSITGKGTTTDRDDYDPDFKDKSGKGYYGFTCYVNSIQMADTITATFHYGDGQTVSLDYSIADYIAYFDSHQSEYNQTTLDLIKAIADYGHYAQPFLSATNNWTIGTDYAEMTRHYTDPFDLDSIRTAVQGYVFEKTSESSKIKKATYRLNLESETMVDVFLAVEDGTELTAAASFNGKTFAAVKQADGRYRIRVSGISAHQLGDTITITGTAGSDFTITVSALAYARAVLNSDDFETKAKNAMAAFYQYYDAVINYRGN